MRIALRQQPAQRNEMMDAIERVRGREIRRRPQIESFDRVIAEMLVEPRPPRDAHQIARLQHRLVAGTEAAAHKTEMAPVLARHQLDDGARLAMAAGAEHAPRIGPVHVRSPYST